MYRAAVQTVRYEGVCRMAGSVDVWMEHVTVYGAMEMAHETLHSTHGINGRRPKHHSSLGSPVAVSQLRPS